LARQTVETSVTLGLQVVDTVAGFVESAGRVSGSPLLQRLGLAEGRLLRRVGEAWAEGCRALVH